MGNEVHTVVVTRNTTIKGIPVSAGTKIGVGDLIGPKDARSRTMVDEGDIKSLLSLKRAEPAEEDGEPTSAPSTSSRKGRK